jgi:hypothetical protein
MKLINSKLIQNSVLVILLLFLCSNNTFSQATEYQESVKNAKPDTVKTSLTDTLQANPTETPKTGEEKTKDKKGKKNEIILYTGINFTQLGNSEAYESENEAGYQLGAYYKQGRLFYWQAGARFANSKLGYKPAGSADTTGYSTLSISAVDIPLTLGVNFTSFMNRVLSVRLFASAVPAFTLKVSDNPYGITKDKINSFILYGQGGIGINVAFLVLEAGYNYGFNELLDGNTDSKPGQVFINLGFRF